MKSKSVQRYSVVDCWILPMSIDDMNVEIVKKNFDYAKYNEHYQAVIIS